MTGVILLSFDDRGCDAILELREMVVANSSGHASLVLSALQHTPFARAKGRDGHGDVAACQGCVSGDADAHQSAQGRGSRIVDGLVIEVDGYEFVVG